MKKGIAALLLFLFTTPALVFGQTFDIANTYEIQDGASSPGDIIIASPNNGLTRTDVSYDNRILGVLQNTPVIVYRNAEASESAIVRTGDTVVNITDYNGNIQKGDYITSSPILGKGMKATKSGYVLGIATSNAESLEESVTFQGKTVNLSTVNVALKIEYAEISTARSVFRLLEYFNAAFFRNVQDPEKFVVVLRYLIAGLLTLIGATFAFFTISKTLTKGVESIGRNPLAKASIQFSMATNVLFVILGLVGVVILDFVILRL